MMVVSTKGVKLMRWFRRVLNKIFCPGRSGSGEGPRIGPLRHHFRQYLIEEIAENEETVTEAGSAERIIDEFIRDSVSENDTDAKIIRRVGISTVREMLHEMAGDIHESTYLLEGFSIREYLLKGTGRNRDTVIYLPSPQSGNLCRDNEKVFVMETVAHSGGAAFYTVLFEDDKELWFNSFEEDRYKGLRSTLKGIPKVIQIGRNPKLLTGMTECECAPEAVEMAVEEFLP